MGEVFENGRKKKWFPLARKSVSGSRNKVISSLVSTSRKKSSVIRVLNRLFYDLNNGFHWYEKKFSVKNNTFSSGLKNVFPVDGMKNSLKNI